MGVYKIRMVTTANENTFYRRLNVPRESYIDLDKDGKIILKHNSNKWKRYDSNPELLVDMKLSMFQKSFYHLKKN